MLIGEVSYLYHPVQAIGWLITVLEKILRRALPKTNKGELIGGMVLCIIVAAACYTVPYILLRVAGLISPILRGALLSVMCWQCVSLKGLTDAGTAVYKQLEKDDIGKARLELSKVVGRDTYNLSSAEISSGVIETVAENTSDGVIAPLLFFAIGGGPLAFLYKGINTMDSMLGYKNDKYMYFGRPAAYLDDLANLIPARVTAMFMVISARLCGLSSERALRILRRDRKNHTSPNSGHPEAACAGALGIQLGGSSYYGGVLVEKPYIGDMEKPVTPWDILLACRLTYVSSALFCIFAALIRLSAVL